MRYGQVTTIFRFGGAGVWSPLDERQFAVHPEEVGRGEITHDAIVGFVLDESGTWAERVTRVDWERLPNDVAQALYRLNRGSSNQTWASASSG